MGVFAHCLAVWPTTLLFWFTALIVPFSAAQGSCFQLKSSKNPLYTTCSAPNDRQIYQLAYPVNIVEHLAATEPAPLCVSHAVVEEVLRSIT